MSLSDLGIWLLVGVVALGVVALVCWFMLRPALQFFGTLAGGAWHGRADLDPRTRLGRWRLLGMACFLAGFLLALQAKGYDVLDPILALVNIEMPGLGETETSIFVLMGGLLIFVILGARCLAHAKRFEACPASEVLAKDTRPPVLYLRSFGDDPKAAQRASMAGFSFNTEEGEIAEIVKSIGPLVAIGRPDEELSYFGAARVYVGAGDWQERVRELLSQARLVIIRAGETAGLSWELEQCAKVVRPERLIILIPFSRRRYEEFCLKSANSFPRGLPEYAGRRVNETTIRAVLYFDADWTPHLLPISKEGYLSYWAGPFSASFLKGEVFFNKQQSNMRRMLGNVLQPVLERSLG